MQGTHRESNQVDIQIFLPDSYIDTHNKVPILNLENTGLVVAVASRRVLKLISPSLLKIID